MDDVQERYATALQSLISKVETDTTILAAVLFGSLLRYRLASVGY